MSSPTNGLRVLVGSDSAGVDDKDAIYADLLADERLASVVDLGVPADEAAAKTCPSVAIDAATLVAGEADRAILFCSNGIGVADRMSPVDAAAEVLRQVDDAVPTGLDSSVLLAYEPFWTIGAERPASPAHVAQVVAHLRVAVGPRWPGLRSSTAAAPDQASPPPSATLSTGSS